MVIADVLLDGLLVADAEGGGGAAGHQNQVGAAEVVAQDLQMIEGGMLSEN